MDRLLWFEHCGLSVIVWVVGIRVGGGRHVVVCVWGGLCVWRFVCGGVRACGGSRVWGFVWVGVCVSGGVRVGVGLHVGGGHSSDWWALVVHWWRVVVERGIVVVGGGLLCMWLSVLSLCFVGGGSWCG